MLDSTSVYFQKIYIIERSPVDRRGSPAWAALSPGHYGANAPPTALEVAPGHWIGTITASFSWFKPKGKFVPQTAPNI